MFKIPLKYKSMAGLYEFKVKKAKPQCFLGLSMFIKKEILSFITALQVFVNNKRV